MRFRDEKEERSGDIEDLAQMFASKIEECNVNIEEGKRSLVFGYKNGILERVTRLEREAQTLKHIGEDINLVQQKLEEEATQRYLLSR